MIEQQQLRNEEKVGYKRERSKGKPWTMDAPKILLSTIQIPSGIHSTPFQPDDPQSFSEEGSCESKPNGHYSLSPLSKSRKRRRRRNAVGQRFIRHCRRVHANDGGTALIDD